MNRGCKSGEGTVAGAVSSSMHGSATGLAKSYDVGVGGFLDCDFAGIREACLAVKGGTFSNLLSVLWERVPQALTS